MTGPPPPRKLRLELGLDCPLLCLHCSAYAAPGNPLTMPTDLAERLLREFAALGGKEVTFTGGEPLVRPNLATLLEQACTLRLETVLFTSGVVYGEAGPTAAPGAQLAALAPVLGRAVFSVYSLDPTAHDAVTRTPGSLELTRQAIFRSVEVGVRTELHFVPTRANYREFPSLVREAAALGVRAIRVLRYVPQGRGRINQDALRLRPDQQHELSRLLRQTAGADRVEVRIGSGFGYLVGEAPPCGAALEELVVGPNGRVYPCSGFSAFRGEGAIENVRDMPLAEVWRYSPYLRAVRDMLAAREAQHTGCATGCLAQKAAATGRLTDAVDDPDTPLLAAAVAV